jgi:mono/diheme cytochrome c family protein
MRVSRIVLYPFAACALAISSVAQAQTDTTKADSTKKDSTTMAVTTVNDDQASRGLSVFTKTCSACHMKEDMTGNDFKTKWSTRPVFDLFELIRTTMPDDGPGTMTRDQYVDVTTYLLRLNGAPSGGMPINNADTTGMHKMVINITVPPVNLDGILKADTTAKAKADTITKAAGDTTKAKVDTAKVRRDMIRSHHFQQR